MENEKPKKKGRGLFTLFACIMTGIIVYFATTLGQELSKVNEKNNVDNNSSESVETEVDDATKKIINEKISKLFVGAEYQNDNFRSSFIVDYGSELFKGNVSDELKSAIVLHGSDVQWSKYTAKNGKFAHMEVQNFGEDNLMYATTDKVNELVKNLFGSELKDFAFVAGCPSYEYDTVNKVYVEFLGCGTAQILGQLIYPEKYSQSENTITITMYVGGYKSNSNVASNSENSYSIYSDYSSQDETKKLQDVKDIKEFKIEDSNKDKFSKYNLVFEKDSTDNYYFKSITKA